MKTLSHEALDEIVRHLAKDLSQYSKLTPFPEEWVSEGTWGTSMNWNVGVSEFSLVEGLNFFS